MPASGHVRNFTDLFIIRLRSLVSNCQRFFLSKKGNKNSAHHFQKTSTTKSHLPITCENNVPHGTQPVATLHGYPDFDPAGDLS